MCEAVPFGTASIIFNRKNIKEQTLRRFNQNVSAFYFKRLRVLISTQNKKNAERNPLIRLHSANYIQITMING